jgi:toxin FitB
MVVKWFERQRTSDLFLSVISIGEIERGIARQRATDPGFAAALADWLDRVLTLYGERSIRPANGPALGRPERFSRK